jgi:hypothetical protein
VTGFFVLRLQRELAHVSRRKAKKPTKREAVCWKALGKDAIQGCRSSEARTTIPNL